MTNKHLLQLASFSLMIVLLSSCGGGPKDPAAELAALKDQKAKLESQIADLEKQVSTVNPTEKRVRTVGISEITTAPFRHYIDLQGKVDADQSVMATSKMPGALKRVLVKNGDNVRQGQLIAEIDDAVMVKSLAELEGQLATATDIYNRQKGLWDQKIGTEVAFIQAKNGKESIERSITTIKEQWGMAKIYAPQSGTVDMVMLKQGQAIAPGIGESRLVVPLPQQVGNGAQEPDKECRRILFGQPTRVVRCRHRCCRTAKWTTTNSAGSALNSSAIDIHQPNDNNNAATANRVIPF